MRSYFFALFFAMNTAAHAVNNQLDQQENPSPKIFLNTLISSPDLFELKKVSVYGHIALEADNYSISTYGCRLNRGTGQGTVVLQLAPPRTTYESDADGKDFFLSLKKYVRFHNSCSWVTGVFDKSIQSAWGQSIGGIKDISSMSRKKPN